MAVTVSLDQVDRDLLRLLVEDGRMANNALAARIGVAPSTCLARTRRLQELGVIRAIRAELDLTAMGRPLQAMISIRLQPGARSRIEEFQDYLAALPGVLNVYFLAGSEDFQLHVAAASADSLRDFVVDSISRRTEVAGTQTSLVFFHSSPRPEQRVP